NLIAVYKLAEEVERQGDDKSAEEFQSLIQKILAAQPDNLAALVETSRIAAKRGDAETFKSAVAKIVARSSSWPEEVKEQVNAVDALAKTGDLRARATRTSFLRNVLMRVPEYRRNLAVIKPPPGEEAIPFAHFLKLEAPVFTTAPADTALRFNPEPVAALDSMQSEWIGSIFLSGEGAPVIATANAREVRLASGATLPFPGSASNIAPTREGILPVDFNYDFKTDLVLAGNGGVRFFRQDGPSAFTDVTNETKLPAATLNRSYARAWSADIEADGDLDIVLGGAEGPVPVLRNNGDGTFTEIQPFRGVSKIKGFAWADLDADGDPDASVLDGTEALHVFSNERQGQFTERSIPNRNLYGEALNVMDVDDDGVFDLLLIKNGSAIIRLSDKDGTSFVETEITKNPYLSSDQPFPGPVNFKIADLDNNGGLDLIVMLGSPCKSNCNLAWLNDGNGKFDLLQGSLSDDSILD